MKNENYNCDLLENLYQEYREKLGNFLTVSAGLNDSKTICALEIFDEYATQLKQRMGQP